MYVYLIECPISNEIKAVGFGYMPKINAEMQARQDCQAWLKRLKKRRKKPRFIILEKVQEDEAQQTAERFSWLLKSWGFNLFFRFHQDYSLEHKRAFIKELDHELKVSRKSLKLNFEVNNRKMLLLFISDLMSCSGVSRRLDELTLITILTFILGIDLKSLANIYFFRLDGFVKNSQKENGEFFAKMYTRFVLEFHERYSNPESILAPVFKYNKVVLESLDSSLKKTAMAFGYSNSISFKESQYLSLYYQAYYSHFTRTSKDRILVGYFEAMNFNGPKTFNVSPDEIILLKLINVRITGNLNKRILRFGLK